MFISQLCTIDNFSKLTSLNLQKTLYLLNSLAKLHFKVQEIGVELSLEIKPSTDKYYSISRLSLYMV